MKNFIKASRIIPDGYTVYRESSLAVVYWQKNSGGRCSGEAFVGKSTKPAWHFLFRSEESLAKKSAELFSNVYSWEETKKKRKAEKIEAVASVKVGDLFVSSWGYEQTNVDFYQCVETNGKTFKIREIAAKSVDGSGYSHGMADQVVPVRDEFVNDKIIEKRTFKLKDYAWLSPTSDGVKHYRSWYA